MIKGIFKFLWYVAVCSVAIVIGASVLRSCGTEAPKYNTEFPDVAERQRAAEHAHQMAEATVAATAGHRAWGQAESNHYSWVQSRLTTDESPVLVLEQGTVRNGNLIPDAIKVVIIGRNDDGSVGDYQYIYPTEAIPEGYEVLMWNPEQPVLVDYNSHDNPAGLAPTSIVAASQPLPNGLAFLKEAWVYRIHVSPIESDLDLAPWGVSKVRDNVEDDGRRTVIDRYTVVLKPGQSSEPLQYVPEPLSASEVSSNASRNWRLRWDGATLMANLNGEPFTFGNGVSTDTSQVERSDGSIDLVVTAAYDAPPSTVVEFVYYSERP